MESATSSNDFLQGVKQIGLKRGRMELLTGLLGYRNLQAHQQRQAKNLEAEEAAVRRKLWGSKEQPPTFDGAEAVAGDTVLGDVNHPAPVIVQKPASVLGPLVMAVLGAAVPGAGIAGYVASQYLAAPAPATQMEDESISIGIGRLEE